MAAVLETTEEQKEEQKEKAFRKVGQTFHSSLPLTQTKFDLKLVSV